jgi:PAS domain S-box-containing protein
MLLNSPDIRMRDEILEILFNTLPYVFWKDINGKYQGGNKNQARNLGFKSTNEFIGKTIFEILQDEKTAQLIDDADNKVMQENCTLVYEEKIVELTGEKIYLSQKSPIHNDEGTVIGMIGFAMDITDIKRREELAKKETENYMVIAAKKEAERLKIENEARKTQLAAQEKFTKTANQVAHDIRSPLASLLMIVKACENIPEKERIALRAASTRINDIANNLLHQYQPQKNATTAESEEQKKILLSATLLQLLTEKKFQYEDYAINFDYQFNSSGQFAFIEIEPSAFKRMLSNLINNAVDALEDKPGKILLKLDAGDDWITITVQDNGKGMSEALINKIMNNMVVTEGKPHGNGIGLTQVRETLDRHSALMSIHSKVQLGTQIILKFPRAPAPLWMVEEVIFGMEDIVIILDDDHSIHGAWSSRFEPILKQAPFITLHHFSNAEKTLLFISSLADTDKKKIVLLTDFELLNQEINGLDVIEKSLVKRAILVTSHYDNVAIQARACLLKTKVLPKQLASEIPMYTTAFIVSDYEHSVNNPPLKRVDAVLIDDDEKYAESLINYVFDDHTVDYFSNPKLFKASLSSYPKDTRIYLDNHFASCNISGVEFAEELHIKGYTRLYLLSGKTFKNKQLPCYLTVILKTDIDQIKDWS